MGSLTVLKLVGEISLWEQEPIKIAIAIGTANTQEKRRREFSSVICSSEASIHSPHKMLITSSDKKDICLLFLAAFLCQIWNFEYACKAPHKLRCFQICRICDELLTDIVRSKIVPLNNLPKLLWVSYCKLV